MAKETIYIGLSLIGETQIPTPGKLISFSAAVGEDSFTANIQGPWECPKFYQKYPDEWKALLADQVSLDSAVKSYIEWSSRYHGRHIAVCSGVEFWWMFQLLLEHTKKCSFGTGGYLDYHTFLSVKSGDYSLRGPRHTESRLPWEMAKERSQKIQGMAGRGTGKAINTLGDYLRQMAPLRATHRLQPLPPPPR